MMVPGLVVALLNRLRAGMVSPRTAAWVFATLAIWGPLLRAPLYGTATLLLAVGAARACQPLVRQAATLVLRWFARYSLPVLLALVGPMAVVSYRPAGSTESLEPWRVCRHPRPARTTSCLIVMDTVRADSLGLYGYTRDTTPHLNRWAKTGVRFEWALAPAPWTFPSHCSFMTGEWPSTLGAHWAADPRPGLSHAGRVSRLAGISDRRVRRQYVLVQLRVGDGPRVRPLRGLSAHPADHPGQHHAGPLDPRERF